MAEIDCKVDVSDRINRIVAKIQGWADAMAAMERANRRCCDATRAARIMMELALSDVDGSDYC